MLFWNLLRTIHQRDMVSDMKKLIVLIMIINTIAFADSLDFSFGQGSKNLLSGDGLRTQGKNLELAYRAFDSFFSPTAIMGVMTSNNIQDSTYVFHVGIGASIRAVSSSGIYIQLMQGVSLLSKETRRLSSQLQYPTSIEIGVQSENKNSIGIRYKHFSDGTGNPSNRGQDYIAAVVHVNL